MSSTNTHSSKRHLNPFLRDWSYVPAPTKGTSAAERKVETLSETRRRLGRGKGIYSLNSVRRKCPDLSLIILYKSEGRSDTPVDDTHVSRGTTESSMEHFTPEAPTFKISSPDRFRFKETSQVPRQTLTGDTDTRKPTVVAHPPFCRDARGRQPSTSGPLTNLSDSPVTREPLTVKSPRVIPHGRTKSTLTRHD